jgi:hypothetical protein
MAQELSEGARGFLQEHLNDIERLVIEEARAVARRDGRPTPSAMDIATAATGFTSRRRLQVERSHVGRAIEIIFNSISPVVLLSALLAVTFGLLGGLTDLTGANDILKIFAGAIVGSAGSGIANGLRRT